MSGGGETLRPGFAEELLARLERDRARPLPRSPWKAAGMTAAGLSIVWLVAGRRRSR